MVSQLTLIFDDYPIRETDSGSLFSTSVVIAE